MAWANFAGQHPLETLYRARDAAQQAAQQARHTDIAEADRLAEEHVLTTLLQAVGDLSELCHLPPSATNTGEPSRQDGQDPVAERAAPPVGDSGT